jgi:hypothetical protein
MGKSAVVIFLSLFMVGFGAGGFAGWYMLVGEVRAALVPMSWQSVPAQVQSAELLTSRGSKGSTTYRADVRYSYSFAGKSYEATRLRVSGFSGLSEDKSFDNVGSFHQDLHGKFEAARTSEQPVEVFVNPAAPEQSVAHRSMRWSLFFFSLPFAFLFSAVGLGAAWGIAAVFGGKWKLE